MKIDFSLRLSLDDIVSNPNEEELIKELIRCRKISGKNFKIIFWNKNLTAKECKNFKERYESHLSELNIIITDDYSNNVWFLIDDIFNGDKSSYRYKFVGDILTGIGKYINITNHIISREGENESRNRWKS